MFKEEIKIRFGQKEIEGTIHEQPECPKNDSPSLVEVQLGVELNETLELKKTKEFKVQVLYDGSWKDGRMIPPRAPSFKRIFVTVFKVNQEK